MAGIESQLQAIGMRALDELSDRLAKAEDVMGGKASKLARKWRKLDSEQKEHIVELCFGVGAALAAAVSALGKAGGAKQRKKTAKRLGKAAMEEAVSAVSGRKPDMKKLKKKVKKAAKSL